MSTIAVLLSLGGVSYAAVTLPRNSVGPQQLRGNAVTSTKIKNGAITLSDISSSTRNVLKGQRGATGASGAAGITGPRGPSDIYSSTSSAPSSVTLPVGKHLVLGFAHTSTPGVTCTLTVGSATDTAGMPQGGSITAVLTVELFTPTAATLACAGGTYSSRIAAISADTLSTP
jgi:hypothetical protein